MESSALPASVMKAAFYAKSAAPARLASAEGPEARHESPREGCVRRILHLDLDCFYVSVEVALNPALAGLPVVVGGSAGRGVVLSASYEARRYGIHAAMPGAAARRLCPHALFVRGTMQEYQHYSDRVMSLLAQYSPVVERASIDEAYVDLTGCERLWGLPVAVAGRIIRDIRDRIGLPASAGVAGSKLTAKVATGVAKPRGLICIMPGYDRRFLAPLPVGVLPGIGKKTEQRLKPLGFLTVADVAAGGDRLERLMGDYGRALARRAQGLDGSPVINRHGAGSMSHERTFAQDTGDPEIVLGALHRLTEKLGQRLRRYGYRARTVVLKLRYADFTTVTRSFTLVHAADLDCELFAAVDRLLPHVFSPGVKVRLVGVAVGNLCNEGYQSELFTHHSRKRLRNLYVGMDQIRKRYGFDALCTGPSIFLSRPSKPQSRPLPRSAS